MVVPGSGLLAERGDHDGIAAALARLSADGALRHGMGATARANVVSRYRAESLLERMADLYEELLHERDRTRGRA